MGIAMKVMRRWLAAGFVLAAPAVALLVSSTLAATDARIEATAFKVPPSFNTGEAFARCPGNKRALGGGVVQRGSSARLNVQASGPLDASGATENTRDGDRAKQWYAAVMNFSGDEKDVKEFGIWSSA